MDLTAAYKSGFGGFALIILFFFTSGSLNAAGITIGSGSTISVGSGTIHGGCFNLDNQGTLNLGTGVLDMTNNVSNGGQLNGSTGRLEFGGDWGNGGSFISGMSTIAVVDKCGDGNITFNDSSEFYNLTMMTTSGKTVLVESGEEQKITNELVLKGASGKFLTLRASIPGTKTFTSLESGGTQLIDWVDVQDNFAEIPYQHLAPGFPEAFNSIDNGGNFRWFTQTAPRPTMSGLGILFLSLLVVLGTGIVCRKTVGF